MKFMQQEFFCVIILWSNYLATVEALFYKDIKYFKFHIIVITYANGSRGGMVFTSVCLSVFSHTKSYMMILDTHLFWGQKVKDQRHES